MRLIYFIVFIITFTFAAFAQKKKVTYEYKKFERFDLEAIEVQGDNGIPGDLSISSRLRKDFKNKLPERKHFHREMKAATDAIR